MKNEITVSAHGRLLTVKVCGGGGGSVERGKRSVVVEFSNASRKRLLQKMATIKVDNLKAVFITLTYGQDFPSPRIAKRHLDSFMKRLRRRYAKVSGFWRLEFQTRGAPHFHLLLFELPFLSKTDLANIWGEIISTAYWDTAASLARPPFTRIELLASHKHAARYVAKYVAKAGSGGGGFNIVSYLTVEGNYVHPITGEVSETIGRFWGIFNAEHLPLADLVEIIVDGYGTKAVDTLRRALAAIRWRVEPDSRYGFFLFEDNPYMWVDYFEECLR